MEDKEFSSINVIPLVDIMLVLLTIVLITATFVVQGSIPVQLPQAKTSSQENLKGLSITITKEGLVFFEGRAVSLLELEKELEKYKKDHQVQILSDRRTIVQSLVNVLDILKRLGFKKVSIKTEVSK
ncbi:ExbD/TolR family protein [Thermocrinis jamiesonii]|uniref:ExbD/TolR family protein n=1 Tax=Thermocrinis jamiesonii TaxID=1302351 RepID=UPI0004958F60|nr:biopolymer transporter ExbD [Thermocrinis jamiesonii]